MRAAMFATRDFSTRLAPRALAANIQTSQPGGGWVVRLELACGRLRRCWLRLARPEYVARKRAARWGEASGCAHDAIDDRDLKFFRNVCGYQFDSADVLRRWLDRVPLARMGRAEVLLFGGGLSLLALAAALLNPYAAL